CVRDDALAAGASYPAITLTAQVPANASGPVMNTATVSGGGELNISNDSATDQIVVTRGAATVTLDVTSTAYRFALFGSAVTLTGRVSDASAGGSIAFYDGANFLDAKAISQGRATVVTRMLPAGAHSLHAYYSGDANNGPVWSSFVPLSVRAVPVPSASVLRSVGTTAVGAYPLAMVAGELDLDGTTDLIVLNTNTSPSASGTDWNRGSMSVLLGNNNGTFRNVHTYDLGFAPFAAALADVNGDGKMDALIVNLASASHQLWVLLGNGDGSFQ